MKLKTLAVACAAMAAGSAFAQAKPPEPDYTLAFNVGAVSDYRFRGISQSGLDPAIQGGVDFAHKSGLYVGAWASSIKWIKDAGGDSDAELDFYGGYKGSVGDVSYDIGVLRYVYPGSSLPVNPDTTELYGAVTFGPATVKYSQAITNAFGFANSKNSYYIEGAATFDLGSGWSVVPHIGYQDIAGSGNGIYSYTDYALTVFKDFGNGLVASLAAIGTDAKNTSYFIPANGKATGNATVVVGLKFNF